MARHVLQSATGLVYIPTMQFPGRLQSATSDVDRQPGSGYWNLGFDLMGAAPPKIPDEQIDALMAETYTGSLLAWDPVTPAGPVVDASRPANAGGTLSTAGGLVFQGANNGHLAAYDASEGTKLWSSDTQTGAMAPPITYSIEGEQYVAIAVGFGGGFGAQGGIIAHGWRIPNVSRILTFKLGATGTLPPLPEVAAEMPAPAGPATASADVIDRGQRIYQRHCSYCHGDGLRTGGLNPDLRWSSPEIHAIWQDIVRGGVLSPVGMVGFADYVSEDDAAAIQQYVLSEANRVYLLRNPDWTMQQN